MFSTITNYYEYLVFEQIRAMAIERDEVIDNDFVQDIACIALNHLPPRYIRHKVDLAASLTDLEWKSLQAQVAKAVDDAFLFAKRRKVSHGDELDNS